MLKAIHSHFFSLGFQRKLRFECRDLNQFKSVIWQLAINIELGNRSARTFAGLNLETARCVVLGDTK